MKKAKKKGDVHKDIQSLLKFIDKHLIRLALYGTVYAPYQKWERILDHIRETHGVFNISQDLNFFGYANFQMPGTMGTFIAASFKVKRWSLEDK